MTYIKLNHDFAKFIDPAFYADIIKKEDEASCVLKLHLLCERFLNVYLDERVPDNQKEFFEVGKGQHKQILKYFNEKLQVSIAFGLPVEIAKPLKSINTIRNDFAHKFDATLESESVKIYFQRIDDFKLNNSAAAYLDDPVTNQCVMADGSKFCAKDSSIAGFTIATFIFINKAAAWLVNDLNRRGQLRTG